MDVSFCLEALEEALAKHGRQEVFNTDQGSQFTSQAFSGRLREINIAISIDGKGQLARPCLHRAHLEVDQIRAGLPPRL